MLHHWDVVWFTNIFTITVKPEGSVFRVFTSIGSNGYGLSDLNPRTIARNYEPVKIKKSWPRAAQE